MKKIIDTGITNLVGIGLIGASAGMVNDMPAGTAKTITGIVPGLQATALVSKNASLLKQKSSYKLKSKKLKW